MFHLLTGWVSVDAAAAKLRGAAIGDLSRAVLYLVLSRTAYIREDGISAGLVPHRARAHSNNPTILRG